MPEDAALTAPGDPPVPVTGTALADPNAPISASDPTTQRIIGAIKTVYDPEIPVDIWELGLIYRIDYADSGDVEIDMTLTSPMCPSAQELPGMVEVAVASLDFVRDCLVAIVWEPPWTPDRMSEVARLELGFF